MRMTLNLKPGALRKVKSFSSEKKISIDDAASRLILQGAAKVRTKPKTRHGILLARNDGIRMTAEEVAATLNDR